ASISGSAATSTENNIGVSAGFAAPVSRQNANPRRALAKPSIELPESPMNNCAGGKLKSKKPAHAPSKLHAIALPSAFDGAIGRAMYPIVIIAATPAAIPSAPSRKLNALMKSTKYAHVAIASSAELPERGIV